MSETTKIYFTCKGHSSNDKEVIKQISMLTPGSKGIWKDLHVVYDINNADWVIALESIPRQFNFDKERTICLPLEPPTICNRKNYVGCGIKHAYTHTDIHQVFAFNNFIGYKSYDWLKSHTYRKRENKINIICSNYRTTPGHIKRATFVSNLISIFPDKLDLYGSGWNNIKNYRGGFGQYRGKTHSPQNKLDILSNYDYSIAIENCNINNYFTEKINDCILSWTTPIYYGCKNISDYLPEGSYIPINIDDPQNAKSVILDLYNREPDLDALEIARNKILDEYNVWETVYRIINNEI